MTQSSGKGNLTEGPVRGHLVRMSVPMLWGILAMISVQLVDTYYIAKLGTVPLAAISFTFPVTMTVFSLIIGMGIAASSVLARKIGEGLEDEVVPVASHALILAGLLGIVMTVIGLTMMTPLFRLMGADDAMMPLIQQYMGVWFCGCAVMALPIVGNSCMRALGDTVTPAMIMIGLSALNAVLAAIMIFGLLGFPRLGVQGAAIAALCSYSVAAMASLLVLWKRKKLIFQGSLYFDRFGSSVTQLLAVAIPVGLATIIQPVSQGILTAILEDHGDAAVAAFGVASRVEAMAFVIIIALATGMSPIIGQNWGADRRDRVRETLKLAMIFSTAWSILIAIALVFFARPLASLFSQDQAVIQATILYFCIVPLSYAAGNLVQGWSSAFNAMGYSKKALSMIVTRFVILQIPSALIGGHFFGVIGVFASIALVNIATGLYFHYRHWNDIMLMPALVEVKAT